MKKLAAILVCAVLVIFAAPAFAATNPFMDVPAGHWAYDAVAQLASRGVVSGYPDGSYKGAQPATRYEMASMVARALAQMDMEKASKQDVELLKRLVLEFKNELDALGVQVAALDKRVGVLEDGIGGWKIRGIFMFDAKFGDNDYGNYNYTQNGLKNEFSKDQFRLFLTKTIDENTYFYAQYRTGGDAAGGSGAGDQQHMRWSHLYVDTKLPWDIGLRVGRFTVDFEDAYQLYMDNDALFGNFRTDGFRLEKEFAMLKATAIIGRNNDFDLESSKLTGYGSTHMTYALDLHFHPHEKFFVGATGYWLNEDSSPVNNLDQDLNTYGFYAGYSFTPDIALRGIYYFQDQGDGYETLTGDDSPSAWKVGLELKQNLLKYTSLYVEYSEQDNAFISTVGSVRYALGGGAYDYVGRNIDAILLLGDVAARAGTSKWIFVKAEQQWNEKWNSFLRFAHLDFDASIPFGTGVRREIQDAKAYGIGVGYQYSPAIHFELAYDLVDHGDYGGQLKDFGAGLSDPIDFGDGKESVIRFRTTISF